MQLVGFHLLVLCTSWIYRKNWICIHVPTPHDTPNILGASLRSNNTHVSDPQAEAFQVGAIEEPTRKRAPHEESVQVPTAKKQKKSDEHAKQNGNSQQVKQRIKQTVAEVLQLLGPQ